MKFRFPTPYTVLMGVIVFAAIATWILPAGNYSTLEYNSVSDVFEISSQNGVETMPATEVTLEELNITIGLETFTSGDISRPVSVPGTYEQVEAAPQGIIAIFMAPIKGMYAVIDIVLLVLVIGGFIGVFNNSGALDKGIAALASKLQGRESVLIILVTSLIALGGTTFGMAEETLAFYPILVPVFLAAGYDLLVPVSVIYIGSSIGTMASTVNPFATIIASNAAGINWTIGLSSRLALLVLGTMFCIGYIVRYGKKVKADPTQSLLHGLDLKSPFKHIHLNKNAEPLEFKTILLLLLFGGTFVLMIIGVSQWHWWLTEMTTLFVIASILMGFLQRTGEQAFIKEFIGGAKDLLGVCFIIGIARGVTIIMNDGKISDTILYESVQIVQGMSGFAFLPALFVVFFVMGFFISSSSGLAVVSMPIMSSLSQIIGVPTEEIVNAYQFGFGLMLFITPAGLVLPSLAMVNVSYNTWLKFIWPLLLILAALSVLILWAGLLL
ncbi:MAG: YfcC family protein [bacterium]|nr:YfcC family protein [bacterium]